MPRTSTEDLTQALRASHPELAAIEEKAVGIGPVYLVGGAVRDLLLGRGRSDIDLVIVGDAAALAAALGGEVVENERFSTAKVELEGHEVDVATARTESYPRPGALPEVEPADRIEDDLARRDFAINAMAIPLAGGDLIDPYGGAQDLDASLLRVLHPRSFVDDPTRALRAARYAARFGFRLEPETEALLRKTDLGTVSGDRRQAELLRLAAEPHAPRGFALLADWGLLDLRQDGVVLAEAASGLLESAPWRGIADRGRVIQAAALGPPSGERELASASPQRPSQAVALAQGRDPVELVLARALGGEWLDRYLLEWRGVGLEIDGGDLVAAGVPEGPAVGRGLAAALRAKLDGEAAGAEQELRVAIEAAGQPG